LFIENPIQHQKIEEISNVYDSKKETCYVIASQVFVPFMIAGFGMVAAGLVLERVKVLIDRSSLFQKKKKQNKE
jgi:hypothetical protein